MATPDPAPSPTPPKSSPASSPPSRTSTPDPWEVAQAEERALDALLEQDYYSETYCPAFFPRAVDVPRARSPRGR